MKQIKTFNILTGSCGKNTNWYLSFRESMNGTKYVMIENTKTGFVDFPIQQGNYIAYNYPERIPKYIQNFITENYTLNF